jgi:Na+/H+ antiporter NhaD/arsenite permease-like protein
VHIGYLAAIVAASNAGGSGSVVGDTTTTMMWIDGISPLIVLDAYVAAIVALVIGYFAAKQQHAYSPIIKHVHEHTHIDWGRIFIVGTMLVSPVAPTSRSTKFPSWPSISPSSAWPCGWRSS